jgi:hypothetical protein
VLSSCIPCLREEKIGEEKQRENRGGEGRRGVEERRGGGYKTEEEI